MRVQLDKDSLCVLRFSSPVKKKDPQKRDYLSFSIEVLTQRTETLVFRLLGCRVLDGEVRLPARPGKYSKLYPVAEDGKAFRVLSRSLLDLWSEKYPELCQRSAQATDTDDDEEEPIHTLSLKQ